MRLKPALSLVLFAVLSGTSLVAQQPDGAPPMGPGQRPEKMGQSRGVAFYRPAHAWGTCGVAFHRSGWAMERHLLAAASDSLAALQGRHFTSTFAYSGKRT